MVAIAKVTTLSPTITRATLADAIKVAMSNAGLTLFDDFTDSANARHLIYRLNFNTKTYGTLFLDVKNPSLLSVSQSMMTGWNASTHAMPTGAIASASSSATTFAASASLSLTAINHPEAKLVLIDNSTNTNPLFLGYVRPNQNPGSWWDENLYPYLFLPRVGTFNSFLSFTTTLSPDNIAAGYYYSPNTISNLTNPDATGAMVQAGALQLVSPGTAYTGKNPRFSNEFGLAAATGYKRGDMLINASDANDKFLLLTPGGNSGICLRSNTPGA
jgi:hypothetical protein